MPGTCTPTLLPGICSGDKSQAAGLKTVPAKITVNASLDRDQAHCSFWKMPIFWQQQRLGQGTWENHLRTQARSSSQAECPEAAGSNAHGLPYRTQHREIKAPGSLPQPGSEIFMLGLANPPLCLRVSDPNTFIYCWLYILDGHPEPCINRN